MNFEAGRCVWVNLFLGLGSQSWRSFPAGFGRGRHFQGSLEPTWTCRPVPSTDCSLLSLTTWSRTSSPSLLPPPDAALEGPPIVTLQWQGEAVSALHGCREGLGGWTGFRRDWKHFQSDANHRPPHPSPSHFGLWTAVDVLKT